LGFLNAGSDRFLQMGFSACGPRKNFGRVTVCYYWNWVRFAIWTFNRKRM